MTAAGFARAFLQHIPAEFRQLLAADTEEDRYDLLPTTFWSSRTLLEDACGQSDAAHRLENA